MVVDWREVVAIVEAAAAFVLAFLLIWKARRRPGPVALGVNFVAFGAILVLLAIPGIQQVPQSPTSELWVWISRAVLWTSLLAFALVYPNVTLGPRRRWFVLWAVLPGFFLIGSVLFWKSLVVLPDGGPTLFFKDLITILRDAALIVSLVVFGRYW